MANDSIKIKHPTDKNTLAAKRYVPRKFVATGLARGTAIQSVVGVIKPEVGVGETKGRQILWLTRRAQEHKYRWMILFEAPGDGNYVLNVNGYDGKNGTGNRLEGVTAQSGPFSVRARSYAAPTIDYPAEDYADISDEAEYFVTYGTWSDPVVLVTLGLQSAEYIYNDSGFWVAQFPPLTSSGTQTITVTDSNDGFATRLVTL